MNRDLIKQRLSELQSKGKKSGDKKDDKIYFKPALGETTIRILPLKKNKDYPFQQVWLHPFDVFRRVVPSLKNWSKKDPVEKLREQLYKSTEQDEKDLAWKLRPTCKTYLNVIVRGEEDKGVRLWEFGKQVEEQILAIMAKEDYGDITDLVEGTDLDLTCVEETMVIGKKTIKYIGVKSITPKRRESPLSEDEDEIKTWMNSQHDPLALLKQYSFEEIKSMLEKYFNPEEDGEEEETTAESVESGEEDPKEEDKPILKNKKVSKESDDLPFEEVDEDKKDVKAAASKSVSKVKKDTKNAMDQSKKKSKFSDLFD